MLCMYCMLLMKHPILFVFIHVNLMRMHCASYTVRAWPLTINASSETLRHFLIKLLVYVFLLVVVFVTTHHLRQTGPSVYTGRARQVIIQVDLVSGPTCLVSVPGRRVYAASWPGDPSSARAG